MGVSRDPRSQLLVCPLWLGMVAVDVRSAETELLVVVGCLDVVPARAIDRSHHVLLDYAARDGVDGKPASRHSGQPMSSRFALRPASSSRRTASWA